MATPHLGFTASSVYQEGRANPEETKQLQTWSREELNLHLSEEQVIQFLISCDHDINLSKITIKEYFEARKSQKHIFSQRRLDDPQFQPCLDQVYLNLIPKRTKNNNVVMLYKLHDSNYRNFETGQTIKMINMLFDTAIYDYPPDGIVMVFDVGQMGLMHMTKIRLGLILDFIYYLQEALPAKLQAIHVLNVVYVVEKIFTLIKPFMKEKLRKQIIMHQKNMDYEKFYENYVEKECLPCDYGGDLPCCQEMHLETLRKIKNLEDGFFLEDETQREDFVL